ncbi:hypothetical protein IQ249_15365 [Lusitaniella coriacea LEGE 07157]|uniref:Uncharacterized protein n=1 Tax=Lusitaniella coriacea LEGE 07157 TaxID=945747 RepID=A0A8J7DXP0_9CYAN|nr:hypothetical protein [Lusitaniella coriacea]MBE9117279.1 hypothetical protein [Lusitaniella coriacea LEGE 07157]
MGTCRFIADTPVQFVRKVAIDYLRFGYVRYALREIPDTKDPEMVDAKLLNCYDITTCATRRARRRHKGFANVVFVRYQRSFVLLATLGTHRLFDPLASYDFRTVPLHFHDYSIGVRRGVPCVRVRQTVWRDVEGRFAQLALKPKEVIERKINALPYARFPGVLRQKFALVCEINQRRKRAGLPFVVLPLPSSLPIAN